MTASEKRRAGVLLVVLVVVSFGYYYTTRTPTPAGSSSPAKPAAGKPKDQKPVPDAAIRLDLIESPADNNVGQKNLFQYRQKPAPPRPPETAARPPVFVPSNPVVNNAPPPPPPFRAFRYEGFSSKNGKFLASLSEGGNTYPVKEGECLLGQYCITRITENQVEIEDVQQKRRQTFTRVQ